LDHERPGTKRCESRLDFLARLAILLSVRTIFRTPRFVASILLPLGLAACAGTGSGQDPFAAAAASLPKRFPACEAEIKAFVALSKLASQLGAHWDVYESALEAMQEDVSDCIEDSYPNPLAI
jgi:hypothetical protein